MPLVQGRKRRAEPEDDTVESPVSSPEPQTQRQRLSPMEDDDAFNGDAGQPTDSSLDQMVKKLVRLALACEYQRRPIRRADVSEKVLGTLGGRQFKRVFDRAQLELRSVFGMEMVELPAREKVTLAQRRAAQKASDKQNKTVASWVLRSILPSNFHDPEIIPPAAIPTVAEESKYTALYTLLVSLISLSGGSLPEAKFERYLRRIDLEDNTPVDGYEKTEKLLKRMEREGYLMKVREGTGPNGEEDISWTVGPRGKVEVGEDGVRGLTKAVYGDVDEEAEEDLERKIARSLGVGERVERQGGQSEIRPQKKRGRKSREEAEEESNEDDDDAEDENDE